MGSNNRDGSSKLFQWNCGVTDQSLCCAPVVRPPAASNGHKQLNKRVAKLLAHRAVENEVNSVVYQSQNVEQVTETGVDFVDETIQ